MLFKIFSTRSLKKSTPARTEPTDQQAKPAKPTATPTKNPSVLGRVLKAMKSPLAKTRTFYTPSVGYDPFGRYPPLDWADFPAAAPPLPSSTLRAANSPRDPQDGARQFAVRRPVEALEAKTLAKEEEKKAKRRARQFDLQVKSDSLLSNHDHLIEAGLQAKERRRRGPSNSRADVDRPADLHPTASGDCVPVEVKRVCVATRRGQAVEQHSTRARDATRQRLLAGRGVSSFYNEGSLGERDEDDGSYEGPFSLESPATRWQRYLVPPSRTRRPSATRPN
ncbi:hypothetical protein FRC04_006824 [Tulasnella sp. 424]|nr:hypothetical protein FRC04_006824 [Tulasnella sp. 424]KAG8962840.1 hypothetical protein FRC05_005088 [Tulasnella sp. 425]